MWYDRKSITPEEAEKERKRLIALEDRDDDEFDDALVDDMVNNMDWSFLNDENPSKKQSKKRSD